MDANLKSRSGENKPILVKLVLVGKLGVGKSAMIVRFLTKRFIGEYDQNIGLMYHHQRKLENEEVRVEILESGGKVADGMVKTAFKQLEKRFNSVYMASDFYLSIWTGWNTELQQVQDFIESSDVHTLWGDMFVLVYAINDRSSFEELIPLRQHLEKVRGPDRPVLVLVGNKKDAENDREVTTQEGLQLSKDMNCSFYEVSTKTSYKDVENVFLETIRDTMRRKMTQQALSGVKRSSHTRIMEIVEKNVGRNRAMSSVRETIDEYCATRSEELTQDLSRDRSITFT